MNKSAICGTRSAANRHRRLGEDVCEECRQAERDHVKNWASRNPERWKEINKTARKRYRSKPEVRKQRSEYNKERLKDPKILEKSVMAIHRRRAKKMNSGIEPYTVDQVLEQYGFVCHICYEEIDLDAPRRPGYEGWEQGLQIDHVIAIHNGGSDTLANVLPSHGLCNMKKGAR